MADEIISANMNLPVPVVGTAPGPLYAELVNACLTIIDQHDHSPGRGVQITPDGLSITSDLSMVGNSLTNAESIVLSPQLSLATLSAIYVISDDLYFNDGDGNIVRLTQSGAVAGTPGSISGLAPPATASYSSGSSTFIFQSNVNVAANLDARNITLRNSTALSSGLTLSPPNAMVSDYTITLPALPASTKILRMTSSGTQAADLDVDNSTIEISAGNLQIKNNGVTQIKLANRATGTTVAAGGVAVSTSSGLFSTASAAYVDVTNLEVTITTTGRPVRVFLQNDGTADDSNGTGCVVIYGTNFTSGAVKVVAILRDSAIISYNALGLQAISGAGSLTFNIQAPASSFEFLDLVAAGTYTYKIQVKNIAGAQTQVNNVKLVAYEI